MKAKITKNKQSIVQRYSQKEVLAFCIKNRVSFSISRQPGSKKDVLLISNTIHIFNKEQLRDYINKDGYIIAPFSFEDNKAIFLENTFTVQDSVESELYEEIINLEGKDETVTEKNYYSDYNSYSEQFNQLYSEIKNDKIQKAILSRVKHVDSFTQSNAAEFYYKLSSVYNNAYLFMYYTPVSGLWMGATPELLLNIENDNVQTVSLAGTRKYNNVNINWNKKEVDEQQFVSDYMESLFDKYLVKNYEVNGPVDVKAGKISHLKTTYNFPVAEIKSNLSDFIIDLHPTPAVCGLPKNTSMDVIHDVELHNRSYYSGFIGKVQKGALSLYVNIRSMKFVNGGVDLYLGGGITVGSDAFNEWQETELKAGTLLDVIHDLNKIKLDN